MGVICLVYIHIHAAGCEQKLKNPSEVWRDSEKEEDAPDVQLAAAVHILLHTFCTLLEVFILILSMPSMKDPAVFPIKQDLDSSHEMLEHVGGVLRLLCREPWSQDDVWAHESRTLLIAVDKLEVMNTLKV